MITSHGELLEWLSSDKSNVDRFVKAVDKVIKRGIVLIVDEDRDTLITGFMANKRSRRVRR